LVAEGGAEVELFCFSALGAYYDASLLGIGANEMLLGSIALPLNYVSMTGNHLNFVSFSSCLQAMQMQLLIGFE